MIVHKGYENLRLNRPVVTLGIFDGVHRGHISLLNHVVEKARETGSDSVVVTFDPHPRLVLSESREGISFLTTFEEKKHLLENTRISHLVVVEFNDTIRNMGACEFIKLILVENIRVSHLVVGYDHHIGRGREGDFATIRECSSEFGFSVERMAEVISEDEPVSSTSVREALLSGRLEAANKLLGYSYSLSGSVVRGREIGRSLGFPTANIQPSDSFKLVPAGGVYAVQVDLEGKIFNGMLSIGSNPTINDDPGLRSVEVHIFDFNGDIYGHDITVYFRFRLRDEIRFGSVQELADQMMSDRDYALSLLTGEPE